MDNNPERGDGIDELRDLMQRANATPWGKTCSALWAQAAKLAEERDELPVAIECYMELFAAYCMGGEITKVLAPFAWLERTRTKYPDVFASVKIKGFPFGIAGQFGWNYKTVFYALQSLPSVSVAQIEAFLEEFRRYFLNLGESLRPWHIRRHRWYLELGELEQAEREYEAWLAAPRSELTDCPQCDPQHEVFYYVMHEQWQEAIAVGEQALMEKKLCDSQPEEILTHLLLPWLYAGQDGQAWAAHLRAYRRYQQSPDNLVELAANLVYLAVSGRSSRPRRVERALRILQRHLPWFKVAQTPRELQTLAIAGTIVLDSLPGERSDEKLVFTLPGEELPWIQAETVKEPTVKEAREWFYSLAYRLAEQFSRRGGHPHPEYEFVKLERKLCPLPAPEPTEDETIPDVSGLEGAAENSLTLGPVRKTAAKPASDTEAEPPLPPVPLTGPWQQMTFAELIRKASTLGTHVGSIYELQAYELMVSNPEVLSARPADLNELETENWDSAQEIYAHLSGADPELKIHLARPLSDPAALLLAQAEQSEQQKDYWRAAQLADEALHAPTCDPLGMRLQALTLLTRCALDAGYPQEAIAPGRDALNLAAAAGLRHCQVLNAQLLVQVLLRLRRYAEAAEVAQNALDVLEQIHVRNLVGKNLHLALARCYQELGYPNAEGRHLEAAVELMFAYPPGDTLELLESTSDAYRKAGDYASALRMQHKMDALSASDYEQKKQTWEASAKSEDPQCEEIQEAYRLALSQRARLLYDYCSCIVSQPGQVPEADVALMEQNIEKMRGLLLDPENQEFFPHSVEWYEADLTGDLGYMYLNCYKYHLAEDYLRAAMEKFARLGENAEYVNRYLQLGHMYLYNDQFEEAAQVAVELEELMREPYFAGSALRERVSSYAKKVKAARED